jgi:hypothetical protein
MAELASRLQEVHFIIKLLTPARFGSAPALIESYNQRKSASGVSELA